MNLLFHYEPFKKEMLEKFFQAVNSPDEIICIFMCSDGGKISVLETMLYTINLDPKRFKIVGYEELCSSAFEFYIRANCEKTLLSGTIGMCHQTATSVTVNDHGKPSYYDSEAYMKRSEKYYLPELNDFMVKCEMTDKEKKRIKKGHDVYFQYDRFKEIENSYTKNTKI